jgi:hypothetical protein
MPIPYALDPSATSAEIAHLPHPSRRPHLAALVPRLTLRFSYRGADTSDVALFDGSTDATRWYVPLGVTFEARATWSFDRVFQALPPIVDDDVDAEDEEAR